MYAVMRRFFPFLDWVKLISGASLRIDLMAGITVALVLIPQSMAYAQLAGLPAYYGLYAAFLPPMLAALFGSSRQLATGPVAVVSLMTAATLEPLATAGSEAYIGYAVMLAVAVGAIQLSLGILRLGVIVNFLSHPVVNGFTNAAALIIASSQLSKLFGVTVDGAEHHYETIYRVAVAALHFTHWPSLGLAALAFLIMYTLKRINPRIPFVLLAVVVTSAIAWAVGLEHNTRAPVASIQSSALRAEIAAFNDTVVAIEAVGAQRARLGRQIADAEQALGLRAPQVLELHNERNLLDARLIDQKERSHLLREKLRGYQLRNVPRGDTPTFHLDTQVPGGARAEDRLWRLKVGNTRLDEAALPLMGGGAVVGSVPGGLPSLALPALDLRLLLQLLAAAAVISLLGFMEAISIAKSMAAKTGQRLDPNQELIGQGLANILGALGRSYPVSGSFSRSAVNLGAGAVTGLSSVFTSVTVAVALLFLTPLLYHIPQSVLAAVIMMAVVGLVNVKGFIHTYRAQKYDGVIAVISFVCTLVFAPHLDRGIMIGLALSIGHYLYRNSRPSLAYLSLHPDFSLRDAFRHGLRQCRHIAVIRFDGPLFFANTSYLEDQINERIQRMPELRHILLPANGINEVDASGEEALSLIIDHIRERGMEVSFSGLNENVLDLMKRTHLYEKIGEDHIFPTMTMAVRSIHAAAHAVSTEEACPLLVVTYENPQMFEPGKPALHDFGVSVVASSPELAGQTADELRRAGLDVEVCLAPDWPPEQEARREPDVVVLRADDANGELERSFRAIRGSCPEAQVILLGGEQSALTAFRLAKLGAYDQLGQPADVALLVKTINRAVYDSRIARGARRGRG